jgi:hypothetical protein
MSEKLTTAQFGWLEWIDLNGGSAWLQGHKVIAAGEEALAGSAVCFLALLLKGALEVKDRRLVVSDYGKRILKR